MGASTNLADKTTGNDRFAHGENFGKNYYGDFHMVLKPELRERATLIARGRAADKDSRRIERLDLTLLVGDLMRLGDWDYIDALVALGKGFDEKMLTSMNLEIHIYGGVDLATDIKAFYLQPDAFAATKGAARRAKGFAKKHKIGVHDIGSKPDGWAVKTSTKSGTLMEHEPQGTVDLREHFRAESSSEESS